MGGPVPSHREGQGRREAGTGALCWAVGHVWCEMISWGRTGYVKENGGDSRSSGDRCCQNPGDGHARRRRAGSARKTQGRVVRARGPCDQLHLWCQLRGRRDSSVAM